MTNSHLVSGREIGRAGFTVMGWIGNRLHSPSISIFRRPDRGRSLVREDDQRTDISGEIFEIKIKQVRIEFLFLPAIGLLHRTYFGSGERPTALRPPAAGWEENQWRATRRQRSRGRVRPAAAVGVEGSELGGSTVFTPHGRDVGIDATRGLKAHDIDGFTRFTRDLGPGLGCRCHWIFNWMAPPGKW